MLAFADVLSIEGSKRIQRGDRELAIETIAEVRRLCKLVSWIFARVTDGHRKSPGTWFGPRCPRFGPRGWGGSGRQKEHMRSGSPRV
jgi:hypothetical protein